jgi:ATP-dependent helicase/nuclease subunit A
VAMTRARERLILSGAAKLDAWDAERSPMGWIAPAVEGAGVAASYVGAEDAAGAVAPAPAAEAPGAPVAPDGPTAPPVAPDEPTAPAPAGPPVTRLSYSGLGDYARCGYRFYVERVLGVPALPEGSGAPGAGGPADADLGRLTAVERGVLVHALLEKLDFRRPVAPTAAEITRAAERPVSAGEAEQIAVLIGLFVDSDTRARLAAATDIRREERFAFLLGDDLLINGVLDVLAREPGGRMLIVDYKSDRLEGADPRESTLAHYATQRLIYALAALRAGAAKVEVAHLFLEAPRDPVIGVFTAADAPRLERELASLAAGVLARRFAVAEQPHRGICAGCPAEGGLCSWPLEMTRRDAPDRLF